MAEYALPHPLVWLVHFPYPLASPSPAAGAEAGEETDMKVEEGIILNVKYSIKAGNALVIYCPGKDQIVELPLKTRIRKLKKVDMTPFYPNISNSFEKNKDHISVNTKRLLRVSLSIADEKITAAENEDMSQYSDSDIDSGSGSGSGSDSDTESDSSEEADVVSSSEEEECCMDLKVDVLSPSGSVVRGEDTYAPERTVQRSAVHVCIDIKIYRSLQCPLSA